jgi:hypothetical protein
MKYVTEFLNTTVVPKPVKSSIDPELHDIANLARNSQSRNWDVLMDPFTCRTIELRPGQSMQLEGDEYFHFAPFSRIILSGKRDAESGFYIPVVECHRNADWQEPDYGLKGQLPLGLQNDSVETLNCCPTYRSGDFTVSAMYGVELVVGIPLNSPLRGVTALVYTSISAGRILDPTRPEGFRVIHEGGHFISTLRSADQMRDIKALLKSQREEEGL